jgi:Tol biopolymer transport system component
MPEWHPSGSLVVHIREAFHVATMTAQGNDIRLLTANAEYFHPEYSPDGDRIAYERLGPPFPGPQVWVMNADGSD